MATQPHEPEHKGRNANQMKQGERPQEKKMVQKRKEQLISGKA